MESTFKWEVSRKRVKKLRKHYKILKTWLTWLTTGIYFFSPASIVSRCLSSSWSRGMEPQLSYYRIEFIRTEFVQRKSIPVKSI